jgi:hypothetical protein
VEFNGVFSCFLGLTYNDEEDLNFHSNLPVEQLVQLLPTNQILPNDNANCIIAFFEWSLLVQSNNHLCFMRLLRYKK